jgi:tetratricopeptide (TPR) repeat protein
LVGRARELAALNSHLAGEGPPLLALVGEPGIGKSRLLDVAATRASAAGWTVLAGGCHRSSGQEAYAPFTSLFSRFLATRSPAQQREDLRGCGWLSSLLPELTELAPRPTPAWQPPPEQERRLAVGAALRLLANVAGPAGTVLLLDDLQWAGEDALELLASLLREPAERPLRIVGAYRDTDVGPDDPLSTALADLARQGMAERLLLPPLAPSEADELLTHLLSALSQEAEFEGVRGGAGEDDVDTAALRAQLVERAGGLPFYLVSCAQDPQTWARFHGLSASAAPWSVTASLQQRVAATGPAAAGVLAVAALIGREAPTTVLSAVYRATQNAHDEEAFLAGLEAALHARLLSEDRKGVYCFPHDLTREIIVSGLSSARRATLQRLIAKELERLPSAERRASELAWRFAEGDASDRALHYALLAGDQAEAVYAHAEAEQHYRAALESAHTLGDRLREAEAQEKLADALYRLARFSEASACLEQAMPIYQAAENWERLAWATAQWAKASDPLGKVAESMVRLEEVVTMLAAGATKRGLQPRGMSEEAMRMRPDAFELRMEQAVSILTPRTAARLYLCFTARLNRLGRYDEVPLACAKTVMHARAAHDRWMESLALTLRAEALEHQGQLDEAALALEEALPLAHASGNLEAVYMAQLGQGVVYALLAEPQQSRRALMDMLQIAREMGDVRFLGAALCNLANLTVVVGEWEEARARYQEAAAAFRGADVLESRPAALGLAWMDVLQGRRPACGDPTPDETLEAAHDYDWGAQLWVFAVRALAERDLVMGNAQVASARLQALGAQAYEIQPGGAELLALRAWAELALGDGARADEILTQAYQLADLKGNRMALVDLARTRALLALRRGEVDQAECAVKEALALARAMPYPYAEAKALWVYGQLEIARGDPLAARARLEQALAICDRLGEGLYRPLIVRALSALPD